MSFFTIHIWKMDWEYLVQTCIFIFHNIDNNIVFIALSVHFPILCVKRRTNYTLKNLTSIGRVIRVVFIKKILKPDNGTLFTNR